MIFSLKRRRAVVRLDVDATSSLDEAGDVDVTDEDEIENGLFGTESPGESFCRIATAVSSHDVSMARVRRLRL